MSKKYEFTGEIKIHEGKTLYQIKRLSDNLIGGWIETEANLSHEGDCFVYNNAHVYGDAHVYDNAHVYDDAHVYGNACVHGNAFVYDNACVHGNACVYDNAYVYGNACVYDNVYVYGNVCVYDNAYVYGNARVYGNALVCGKAIISERITQIIRSDGYGFIYVPCSDGVKRIIAGCRYMTKEEAIEHWNETHERYKETIIILNALFQIGEL